MYSYIKGIVTIVNSKYIVIENNGIGYLIHVPNPYSFIENKEYIIYLYQHIKEDENTLYGFKSIEDKDLFLRLIEVKGLGPKMAIPMIASGSSDEIIDSINRGNIMYLKKFPKIGEKLAKQIVLDLKGKMFSDFTGYADDSNELIGALKNLGYKEKDINLIIKKIDSKLSIENKIKEALKLLLK